MVVYDVAELVAHRCWGGHEGCDIEDIGDGDASSSFAWIVVSSLVLEFDLEILRRAVEGALAVDDTRLFSLLLCTSSLLS